jgi:hypothetical protein
VFALSNGNWQQQANLKASNTEVLDEFGTSVSLSTDGYSLAIGSAGEDGAATGMTSNSNYLSGIAGAVYLYCHGMT